jgi:hypothetical protein
VRASHINPPGSHLHEGCASLKHFCFCHDAKPRDCRKCAAAHFNKAMAEIYRERMK